MRSGVEQIALAGNGLCIAVVAARWNATVVEPILRGVLAKLDACEAARVAVVRVPGAFELPFGCKLLAETGEFHAVIALGAVIRGDTPHFEYVAGPCAHFLAEVGQQTGVPVIFGVLTTNDAAQAALRADPAGDNKGGEAARAAVEMALLCKTWRNCAKSDATHAV